jgi:glycosyltransferase involved in cell wall biosynthesis
VIRQVHFMTAPFGRMLTDYGHLMRALIESGADVHLWTMEPIDDRVTEAHAPGLRCHRLALVRGRHRPLAIARTFGRGVRLAVGHPQATFTTWSVHTNLLCGLPLRALGRRCVFLVPGMGTTFSSDAMRFRLARRVVAPAYRWLFGGPASRVIVQNEDDLTYVTRGLGVDPSHVHLMHGCGVDPASFPFLERMPDRRPPVVLVPARLIREKGIHEAAQASRILHGRGVAHELWFSSAIDPGNPHSLTQAEVDALPAISPAVRVLGHQPSMVPLLRSAHVVCLPTYREGLPTALIEAAACGRPIVTTDVIGARDMVEHERTGLLVPVRDPAALADAIERLLGDAALAERLRRRAHAGYLERCTRAATLAQALEAYASLGPAPAR